MTPSPTLPTTSPARRPWFAWTWLLLALGSRIYLVGMAALAACAVAPMVFGLTGSVVQSGSMEPTISAGDVVLSLPVDADDPVPMGRVVTFSAPPGSLHEGLILHRVVDQSPDGSLVTAGDANADVDSAPLAPWDVIARACVLVPWVGLPALWIGTGNWTPLAIWIALTVLALVVEAVTANGTRTRPPRSAQAPDGSPTRRSARRLAPAATAGALVIALATLTGAGVSTADAAFSARTVSVGNSWSSAALAPGTRLAFTTNPSNATGGRAFTTQPVVTVRNAAGQTVTGMRTVTLSLTNANGAVLTCAANPVASTTGRVAFTGCAVDKVGTYTLTATSGSLTAAVSTSITISTGPAAALRFTAQPTTSVAGMAFATQPAVSIVDAGGNVTTSTASVALTLTTPAGATLTCTANPRAASAGKASFAGCRINRAGNYTLTATSSSLTSAVSATFVVTPAPPPRLTCTSSIWYVTYSWSPTPFTATTYRLYVNGVRVDAIGADGWNSMVQLMPANVPVSAFPQGTATVEVRKLLSSGLEETIGFGDVLLGPASFRTYLCG